MRRIMKRLLSIALSLALASSLSIASAQETTAAAPAALKELKRDEAVLILVDYTDGLFPYVNSMEVDVMLNNAVAVGKIARLFDVPTFVLGDEGGFYGDMHPAIKSFSGKTGPFKRTTPSGWDSGELKAAVERTGRRAVIIGGVTTDNCVMLTTLDLIRDGYDVYVIPDISGTESIQGHEAAIQRMRDAGAATVSWIGLGSELLGDWASPEGQPLTAIYSAHINGPHASPRGNTYNLTSE